MHFAIGFLTEYVYDAPVSDNLNALRVRPATTSTQRCDEFTVRIDPEARVGRHSDYFGIEVLEFGIVRPHTRMSIDVRARVVTAAGDNPDLEALDELCAAVRAESPLATVQRLCDLISDRYEYRPGVTYVGSTVEEFLDAGAGVRQDYVHLGLIMLRRNGIAARYVSGYLWAAPADGGDDSVEVETHAWLEALLPGADGRGEPVWVGCDEPPPRGRAPCEDRPRPPLRRRQPVRGVYQGTAGSQLDASVHMTRLDPRASARA